MYKNQKSFIFIIKIVKPMQQGTRKFFTNERSVPK